MPDDFTHLLGLLLVDVNGLRNILIIYNDDRVGKKLNGLWKIFFLWKPALCYFLKKIDQVLKKMLT